MLASEVYKAADHPYIKDGGAGETPAPDVTAK